MIIEELIRLDTARRMAMATPPSRVKVHDLEEVFLVLRNHYSVYRSTSSLPFLILGNLVTEDAAVAWGKFQAFDNQDNFLHEGLIDDNSYQPLDNSSSML